MKDLYCLLILEFFFSEVLLLAIVADQHDSNASFKYMQGMGWWEVEQLWECFAREKGMWKIWSKENPWVLELRSLTASSLSPTFRTFAKKQWLSKLRSNSCDPWFCSCWCSPHPFLFSIKLLVNTVTTGPDAHFATLIPSPTPTDPQ